MTAADVLPFDREDDPQAATPAVTPDLSRTTRARWRQAQALKMALQGSCFEDIAAALGYSGRGSAWKAVQAGLAQDTIQSARESRALEVARLDALQVAYWDKAVEEGDLKAADLVMRVIAQRIRLLGLDSIAGEFQGHATIVVGGVSGEYIAALRRISERGS